MAKLENFVFELGVLVVLVAVMSLLAYLFLEDIVVAVLNGVIIFVFAYRAYYDIRKHGINRHVPGLILGMIFAWLMPPLPQVWDVTLVLLFSVLFAELLRVFSKARSPVRARS